MMKRVTWFAGGVVAGAASTVYAGRKIKRKAQQLKPVNVAKSAASKVKGRAHDLVEAVREGREAMREKEAELKARRDGEPEVEVARPAEVIVLRRG